MLMKEVRPFAFFGLLSALFMLASGVLMVPVLYEYALTGLVPRQPTWVLSMALMMISFVALTAGTILDSVARSRAEHLRLWYASMPALTATFRQPAEAPADGSRRSEAA